MKLEITSLFVIYFILFRLAIIITGMISIFLGYRLFCRGVWPFAKTGAGTDINAQIAGSRFTIRNAAPGTCFALFGVVIISIMFAKGGPELTLKNIKDAAKARVSISEMRLRGDKKSGLKAATLKGLHFEKQQDIDNAITAYEEALLLMAEPMNNLAWLYQKQDRNEQALPISRLAVHLAPNNPNYLDTLAEILAKKGEREEATKLLEKAARINPKYLEKLKKLREGRSQEGKEGGDER